MVEAYRKDFSNFVKCFFSIIDLFSRSVFGREFWSNIMQSCNHFNRYNYFGKQLYKSILEIFNRYKWFLSSKRDTT